MPAVGLRKYVEARPGIPLPHGLLSAATVIDVTDRHELNGVDWEPTTCVQVRTTDWCPPPTGGAAKTFVRDGAASAAPVTAYYATDCPPMGRSFAQARDRTLAGLLLGEQAAVEQWVWQNVIMPAAVNRTPGAGPVNVVKGIATVEGWLAETATPGVGVVHLPVGLSAIAAAGSAFRADDMPPPAYTTWAGNRVALGAGYQVNTGPTGAPAPEGQGWVVATGQVTIRRDAEPQIVPPDTAGALAGVGLATNAQMVIAERTFVVQVECVPQACLCVLDCCG